jgi:hypothetical protein
LDGLAFEWLCPRDRVHTCDERHNRQKNRLISGISLDLQSLASPRTTITARKFRGHGSVTIRTVVRHTKLSPEMANPPCYVATTKTHGRWHRKNDEPNVRRKSVGEKSPGSNGVRGPVIIVPRNAPIKNS